MNDTLDDRRRSSQARDTASPTTDTAGGSPQVGGSCTLLEPCRAGADRPAMRLGRMAGVRACWIQVTGLHAAGACYRVRVSATCAMPWPHAVSCPEGRYAVPALV